MKILSINSYYYSSSVHKNLSMYMIRNNIEYESYIPLSNQYKPRRECSWEESKCVYNSRCYNKNIRYLFRVKNMKILKDIENKIDIRDYDCIHAHSLFSNGYVAMKISKKYKIPYIITIRDTDLNFFFKIRVDLRRIGIEILKNAASIIFLSYSYKNLLVDKYLYNLSSTDKNEILKKSYVIPNGVDKFWLNNINKSKKINLDRKVNFIYVGEISKRKNIEKSIEAINIIKNKGFDISFTVVGNVKCKKIYNRIKRNKFINVLDLVDKNKLIKLYRENDIFIMPSKTESFGLVYVEAMTQALPIIYSENQGFDLQFKNGLVGYSVKSNNANNIADRIIDIINDYSKISSNCVYNVNKFDWNNIVNQIYLVYDSAIRYNKKGEKYE